jgi:hypothetical protein
MTQTAASSGGRLMGVVRAVALVLMAGEGSLGWAVGAVGEHGFYVHRRFVRPQYRPQTGV